jgi:hypothetical protein
MAKYLKESEVANIGESTTTTPNKYCTDERAVELNCERQYTSDKDLKRFVTHVDPAYKIIRLNNQEPYGQGIISFSSVNCSAELGLQLLDTTTVSPTSFYSANCHCDYPQSGPSNIILQTEIKTKESPIYIDSIQLDIYDIVPEAGSPTNITRVNFSYSIEIAGREISGRFNSNIVDGSVTIVRKFAESDPQGAIILYADNTYNVTNVRLTVNSFS